MSQRRRRRPYASEPEAQRVANGPAAKANAGGPKRREPEGSARHCQAAPTIDPVRRRSVGRRSISPPSRGRRHARPQHPRVRRGSLRRRSPRIPPSRQCGPGFERGASWTSGPRGGVCSCLSVGSVLFVGVASHWSPVDDPSARPCECVSKSRDMSIGRCKSVMLVGNRYDGSDGVGEFT